MHHNWTHYCLLIFEQSPEAWNRQQKSMAATMETNRKSSTSFHRVIPDALKLHDSRTRVINPDIKVLLHHPSDQHKVTNDDSTVLSQCSQSSSSAEKLDRVTSNLSAKAAVFVPKSSISETNARKFHANPKLLNEMNESHSVATV